MGAARAESAAHRADRDAALQTADAQLEAAISAVRDAQRRIDLYRNTLIPQAETTFQSVLGGYQTGRSTVASALLAQRDLLELQLELARNRARHARAWAVLEAVVGRTVQSTEGEDRP
jgi:outer membrane protein TolC